MKIGVDVDSVLASIMDELVKYLDNKRGKTHILEDISINDLYKIWGITEKEMIGLVEGFYQDKWDTIVPIGGSVEGIKTLKDEGHELFVITARPDFTKEKTIEWLELNYGKNTFTNMIFTDKFRNPNAPKKPEIMKTNNIDILIDDEPHNCADCSIAGFPSVLFNYNNKYPWARGEIEDSNITRALSWDETIKIIDNIVLVKNE